MRRYDEEQAAQRAAHPYWLPRGAPHVCAAGLTLPFAVCPSRAPASDGSCLLPAPVEGGWRLPAALIVPNFALARVARALCVQSAAAAGWLGTKSHRRTAGARDQARSSGHVEALANVRY